MPPGPRVGRRRLGQLPSQRRPGQRGERRGHVVHRHQRGADAQSVPRLERAHERSKVMAKKTKKPRRKAAALRIAKSRSAAKSKPAPSRKPASPAADPRYQIEQLLYRQAGAPPSKERQGVLAPVPPTR